MALTPERKVKNKLVAILKQYEAWYCYPVASGYGSSGIPDVLAGGGLRAVQHEPRPTSLFREESGILVGGHHQPKSLHGHKVLRFCQRHARTKW